MYRYLPSVACVFFRKQDRYLANTQFYKHVIIASKRCFNVIITCLLRFVFSGYHDTPRHGNVFPVTDPFVTGIDWALVDSSNTLHWRHNGQDSVSNQQPRDCLLNRYSDADQRKHQSSASLAFVRGIHRGPVNSTHKWPVTRKKFPFDDVIMGFGKTALKIWYWNNMT